MAMNSHCQQPFIACLESLRELTTAFCCKSAAGTHHSVLSQCDTAADAGTPHKALMTALAAKWRAQKATADVSTVSGCTDLGLRMEDLRL